ncbi:RNA polymerase sigma factor [Sphingopyxis sp. JAI128]|uniref:RNA polymerase sigma factor n=1 Tax=Sphingopyxis sp. JAI128 TaxID=2723066 RepID=UPI00161FBEFB|nr:RNA polymerase sigma factor [Sphingopyxis sp. JAI128]MBB6425047.1 RNA polymerase sigma-70 factor (ECF subfamily) [Sphingopyxis sp. JAI128]
MAVPHPDRDLAAWMTTYGPGLRRYFSRRANEADVDDLVQEVFMRLQSAELNAPIDNVERYLFTAARNALISRHRRQKARSAMLHDEFEESLEIADQRSPERIVIGQQEYRRVLEAIQNLPPRAREAFQYHRFENLTYQAIAQRMGISKEAVKELMHRALVRIAEEMEPGL